MRSIFYLLDVAPYGCEKVYGVLNIAAVSIKMEVTMGYMPMGSTLPWPARIAWLLACQTSRI